MKKRATLKPDRRAKPKGYRVKIRGQNWRIVIGRPPQNKCDGLCSYRQRTIWLRPGTEHLVSTAIHESLHACFPDIDEPTVIEAELSIAEVLRRLPIALGKSAPRR